MIREFFIRYNGISNNLDRILTAIGVDIPTTTHTAEYWNEDVNMDGTVRYTGTKNDCDPILLNVCGATPTNTISEQGP